MWLETTGVERLHFHFSFSLSKTNLETFFLCFIYFLYSFTKGLTSWEEYRALVLTRFCSKWILSPVNTKTSDLGVISGVLNTRPARRMCPVRCNCTARESYLKKLVARRTFPPLNFSPRSIPSLECCPWVWNSWVVLCYFPCRLWFLRFSGRI